MAESLITIVIKSSLQVAVVEDLQIEDWEQGTGGRWRILFNDPACIQTIEIKLWLSTSFIIINPCSFHLKYHYFDTGETWCRNMEHGRSVLTAAFMTCKRKTSLGRKNFLIALHKIKSLIVSQQKMLLYYMICNYIYIYLQNLKWTKYKPSRFSPSKFDFSPQNVAVICWKMQRAVWNIQLLRATVHW